MAEEATQTPEDKAAAAQGAGETDLDPATQGGGNPAPAEPPKNKAEADAAAAAAKGEDPDKKEDKGEDDTDKKDDTQDQADDNNGDDKGDADEDKPLDTDVWGTTGDEVGDSVLGLLQNSGMTVEDAKAIMYDAVRAGDTTKIDKDVLVEKVGKDKANLILAGAENFVSRSKAKAETILTEVHTAVGGKDNWDAVTTWAKDNVPAADLADYREMIDAGGAKARFAATELASRFNGDSGNTTLNADNAEIAPDAKAASSGRALTKAQYVDEMKAAHGRGASEAEINEIKAARARGRAKKI